MLNCRATPVLPPVKNPADRYTWSVSVGGGRNGGSVGRPGFIGAYKNNHVHSALQSIERGNKHKSSSHTYTQQSQWLRSGSLLDNFVSHSIVLLSVVGG